MELVIYNNNSALIIHIDDYYDDENNYFKFNIWDDKKNITGLKTNLNNAIVVSGNDEEEDKKTAFDIAEALVGPNGQITRYDPCSHKKTLKYINKNMTD